MTRDEAMKIRSILTKGMSVSGIADSDASCAPTLFPSYESLLASGKSFTQEDVQKRFRFTYGGKLYVVTQAHTMQSDWSPETAVSLYEEVQYKNGIRLIPENITAENPFSAGERGMDADGVIWVSNCDNNVYTPSQYERNWTREESGTEAGA